MPPSPRPALCPVLLAGQTGLSLSPSHIPTRLGPRVVRLEGISYLGAFLGHMGAHWWLFAFQSLIFSVFLSSFPGISRHPCGLNVLKSSPQETT